MSRGIVESKNRIGFYVARKIPGNSLRIALIIFAFDSFQEVFFKTFRDSLGEPAHIDIFFHHNNIDVLESIVASVRGKYGMYVVAPIPHQAHGRHSRHPAHEQIPDDRPLPAAARRDFLTW